MLRQVKGDARTQSNIEPAEFQYVNVGNEVCKEGKAFADVEDIVAEIRGEGQGMGITLVV